MARWILLMVLFSACSGPVDQALVTKKAACDGGPLLLGTSFGSYDELKSCVDIRYDRNSVILSHHGLGGVSSCTLTDGVTEHEIKAANEGSMFTKLKLLTRAPMLALDREDIQRAFLLSRRKPILFGEGDVAFYDLAYEMMYNIDRLYAGIQYKNHFTEKGFVNTFNHFLSQAVITALFSERLADFIADSHELARIPELVNGNFSQKQLEDLDNGVVDNYVDLLNNEFGQEFGKQMKTKYQLNRNANWDYALMTAFLNEAQSYAAASFGIAFEPFRSSEIEVIRFTDKVNAVMFDISSY